MESESYRVMVTTPVKVAVDCGYCAADKETRAINLTPARMTFMLFCGAQFEAEDRECTSTIRVFIPLGRQVGVGIELPRTYFIRV